MNYSNYAGLMGQANKSGFLQTLLIAPLSAFKTIAEPLDPNAEGGASLTIKGDHFFKEDQGFVKVYTTKDTLQLLSELVGERDGYNHNPRVEFFYPGASAEAIAFANRAPFDSFIILARTLEGKYLQIGSRNMGADVNQASFSSGTLSGGRKGYTFAADSFDTIYVYEGQITVKPDQIPFDLFISSSGNDINDGSTEAGAVASIGRLQTLALDYGHGVNIKFLNEAHYRNQLDLSSLQNVTIDLNYSTLDASNIITQTWSQPDAVNYPNVWSISLTHNMITSADDRIIVLENGLPMKIQTSLANLQANAGSRFVLNDNALATNNPTTVYIHATGGGNPNTNGNTYEASIREAGLKIGDKATVINMVGQNGGHNYGSLHGGFASGEIKKTLLLNATRHAFVFATGEARDCIAYQSDYDKGNGQYAFTFYRATPLNTDKAVLDRCFVLEGAPSGGKTSMGGFYHHGATNAAVYPLITYNHCFTRKMSSQNKESFGGFGLRFELFNSYSFDIYRACFPVANTVLIDRFLLRDCSASFLYAGTTPNTGNKLMACEVKNCAVYSGITFAYPFALFAAGTYNLHHNTFYSATLANFLEINNTLTVDFSHNIIRFTAANRIIKVSATSTYTGDYNIYMLAAAGDMKFEKGGTLSTGLAAWQTATGADQNSVYVTIAQQANFWLGDPAAGDFRINPEAQVTAANGQVFTGTFPDGTPLTGAGTQERYNYNTRQAEKGAPTQWPVFPVTLTESRQYIKNPVAWNYYA